LPSPAALTGKFEPNPQGIHEQESSTFEESEKSIAANERG
jgi:hypothetical protein